MAQKLMVEMLEGDMVTVFYDPGRCLFREGKAQLIKKCDSPSPRMNERLEFWEVILYVEGKPQNVKRLINKEFH